MAWTLSGAEAAKPSPHDIPYPLKLLEAALSGCDWFQQAPATQAAPEVSTEVVSDAGPQTALQQEVEASTEADGATTLMMYDIPFQVTEAQVIDTLAEHGFADMYDFICMPPSKGAKSGSRNTVDLQGLQSENLGYAFIDFKTVESAHEFLRIFQNFSFPNCISQKLTCTKPARCQGYNGNKQRRPKVTRRGKH